MDLILSHRGTLWQITMGEQSWRCAVGRGGARHDKTEGDGATPVGSWPLRRVLYRADRLAAPETALSAAPIKPDDGWCDDPNHAAYNLPVTLPHPARHERLWREDRVYDLIVVLGHNDSPPVAGRGSAIFLHLARTDYGPTEGCVAMAEPDLRAALARLTSHSRLRVPRDCVG